MLVGFDEADQQCVYQDVMGCAFAGQHLGQRHAGRTRDRGRGASRPRRLGPDVENVDHPPPPPFLHLRPHQPGEPDRSEQFQIEILAPDLVGDILEGAGARGAGIVHNDVDLAERLHCRSVSALQVGSIGHVALQADDTSRGGRCNGLGRLVERLASTCDDRHVGAGAGKP